MAWSGKAATKGYWKCHGKKNTENAEILLPRIPQSLTKISEIGGQVFSVVSSENKFSAAHIHLVFTK